jgi:hypothetical protein
VDVHLRCQYLTSGNVVMRSADYDATLLVHAVKGKDIKPTQYATVQVGGAWVSIRNANRDRAIEWFAEWAAPIVTGIAPVKKVLVPIPNRRAFVGSGVEPRTAALAAAIQAKIGDDAVCADVLRWRRELPKSTNEASRKPEVLLPDLLLVGEIPWGRVVLVDDVFTSGGPAIASAWRLSDAGRAANTLVCCGRTTWLQLDDPFNVPSETLCVPERPATD